MRHALDEREQTFRFSNSLEEPNFFLGVPANWLPCSLGFSLKGGLFSFAIDWNSASLVEKSPSASGRFHAMSQWRDCGGLAIVHSILEYALASKIMFKLSGRYPGPNWAVDDEHLSRLMLWKQRLIVSEENTVMPDYREESCVAAQDLMKVCYTRAGSTNGWSGTKLTSIIGSHDWRQHLILE